MSDMNGPLLYIDTGRPVQPDVERTVLRDDQLVDSALQGQQPAAARHQAHASLHRFRLRQPIDL